LSSVRIPALIVNSAKFSLYSGSLIEHFVILINIDVAPVRHFNGFLDFLENGHGLVVLVVEHDLGES
jgi:hypothetical protein